MVERAPVIPASSQVSKVAVPGAARKDCQVRVPSLEWELVVLAGRASAMEAAASVVRGSAVAAGAVPLAP